MFQAQIMAHQLIIPTVAMVYLSLSKQMVIGYVRPLPTPMFQLILLYPL